MRKIRRTRIRTETSELLIIRTGGSNEDFSRCDDCGRDVRWLTFGEAAKKNDFRVESLSAFVEAGRVHFRETLEGHLLLCPNSLLSINRS